MEVDGRTYRTVWMEGSTVFLIEQNLLPFEFRIRESHNYIESCIAIQTMAVRGAGAIGAMAGFAMAQAFLQAPDENPLPFAENARKEIEATRPTARNLFYATERVFMAGLVSREKAVEEAQRIADKDAADSRMIGEIGNVLIPHGAKILTHCNAGWLAFVDHGTALSPVYVASERGKAVFVYVDETRPRSQGARLTAWELNKAGIPHRIIPDNAGAHLMSQGMIDLVITGADRIALNGDSANKIGTLEKAIMAKEYNIPFYIAAPTSTIDIKCRDGSVIVIEERDENEVLFQEGPDDNGQMHRIRVCSPGSGALNPAFDVTPAKYITGIITEKGLIKPSEENIINLIKP
ncbi:MAG: S-methyl-5-thioribose-1-phosphate isomerase [Bacteroidetes bacterium]|nr:S-methyl-5-thioribose-1-phosphate isomerase [Bacteroidota bacterium]